jgi:PAS domain S-box-containing protein
VKRSLKKIMETKLEQSSATNPNPVVSVGKDGSVLYSNAAGEPLLHEWGARVGEKLPFRIRDFMQRVISRNSPEKKEVKVGNRVYLVAFHPSIKEDCINIYGFDISDQKELEGKYRGSEAQETANMELADIVDARAIQSLMDDFYKFAHVTMALVDLKGNVLVGVGWQDICTKFHRVHPDACKHCVESDTKLSGGVSPGEFKLYKCKNNMWDIATPIIVGGQHVGNIFSGQFFFEDEPLDYEFFRSQARQYSFNEEEYIAALEKVPRLSRETVDAGMAFLTKLANMLSQLGYSNIKLAKLLAERNTLVDSLQEIEKRERSRSDELAAVLDAVPVAVFIARDPQALHITGNRLSYEWIRIPVGTNFSKSAPEEERPEMFKLFKDGVEIPPADMPSQMAATGIEINDYELDIASSDGKIRHVLGNARPLRDEQGNLSGSVSAFIDITERKKAEEALRLSNIYNRSLIEASLDPQVTIGPDGKITDVNGATEQVTGYSRNDLIGTDFSNYFTEPEEANASYQQVFIYGEVRDYPLEIQHKDGHITPVLYNASVYRDENGEVIGVFAAARDITARKKAEEALKKAHENLEKLVEERTIQLEDAYKLLKESEEHLAEAQKMAHIGNWDWDLLTGELYWSDELYRIFERNPQEPGASYEEFLNYVHPDDRDYVDNTIEKGIKGKPHPIDYRIISANGKERIVHSNREVIFDEKNTPIRMRGTVQDITELKKSEEKIKILANVVESSNDAIMTGSLDGIATSWNKGAEQIYGYSAEEIIGQNVSILEPDHLKGEIKQFNEKIKRGEKVKNYETLRLKKDGTPINVSVTLSPIFDASGKLTTISVIARDITERIKAEKSLAKAEDARKKEIHHRIKNNLQVISSLLDLQADKFSDPKVIEAFRESQSRVVSMALIHEELYKEEGTDTLNFSEYLKTLAENLFQTYRLNSKNIHLKMDLEENSLFDMDTAIPLGIIVNELISNSLKHAFPDRDIGEIQIKLQSDENKEYKIEGCQSTSYTLTVSDNGVGIPENMDIENLDSLGLQLVISLVDQLDGELELKRHNGTKFTIRFTVTETNNQASETASQQLIE